MAVRAALCVIGLAIAGSCARAGPPPSAGPPGEAVVTRVLDGDTVEVSIGNRRESVRLIGIDTPEIAHPPEPAECYGPEASAFLKTLLPPGTAVLLSRDAQTRDPYERLLAYVVRADDDLDLNRVLLEQGYATTLSIAPNTTHAAAFAGVEAQARAESVGLWSAC